MLKTWFKIIKTAVIVIGLLLSFFAFIEILRTYHTLYTFNPIAGYVFAGVIAFGLIWLIVWAVATIGAQPPVLVPPRIGEPKTATRRQLKKYAKYLTRYMARLSRNPNLGEDHRQTVAEAIDTLAGSLNSDEIAERIEDAQEKAIGPALQELDALAEKEIRACVAVVMAGVTLSPYKAADLMIVVYRNIVMATRIMRIYNSRPRIGEQLKIASDIIAVVATVNYINMGKNLIEGLTANAPFIGRYADDIAQGIGAGFMTSVVGHAAIQRCKAFTVFSRTKAVEKLKSKAAHFYEDVRDMFKKDILPSVVRRIGDASKDTFNKIASALDDTTSLIGNIIRVPIGAAFSAGTAGGKAVYQTSAKGVSLVGKVARVFTKPFRKK